MIDWKVTNKLVMVSILLDYLTNVVQIRHFYQLIGNCKHPLFLCVKDKFQRHSIL